MKSPIHKHLRFFAAIVSLAGCSPPPADEIAQDTGIQLAKDDILQIKTIETGDGYVVIVSLLKNKATILESLYFSSRGDCAEMIPLHGKCAYIYGSGRSVFASIDEDKLVLQVL